MNRVLLFLLAVYRTLSRRINITYTLLILLCAVMSACQAVVAVIYHVRDLGMFIFVIKIEFATITDLHAYITAQI